MAKGRKIVQSAKNFLGGVNDAMNFPSRALGRGMVAVGNTIGNQNLANAGQSLYNAAREASDMGQEYGSAGYMLGTIAPGVATLPAAGMSVLPAGAAAIQAMPAATIAGIEGAGVGALGSTIMAEDRPTSGYNRYVGEYEKKQTNKGDAKKMLKTYISNQLNEMKDGGTLINNIDLVQEYLRIYKLLSE